MSTGFQQLQAIQLKLAGICGKYVSIKLHNKEIIFHKDINTKIINTNILYKSNGIQLSVSSSPVTVTTLYWNGAKPP